MLRKISLLFFILLIFPLYFSCSGGNEEMKSHQIAVTPVENEQRVDVTIDGSLFTSFLYTDTIPDLKKTVLFPLTTSQGHVITRGFPLQPRPGERIDHPHHIGLWLNYGEVNELDYWGNSNAIPASRFNEMGVIRNDKIVKTEGGTGKGVLEVQDNWLKPDQSVLLKEHSQFVFLADANTRIIDRTTTLTAQDEKVHFNDTKEGMMAIRVTRALELPSDKPIVLIDTHGDKTNVPVLDNTGVSGDYLNSNGVTGLDVWGKRAKWIALSGVVEGEDVSVVIFDNPENVGHPTYWHARGYGLFSVNPLGVGTFSEGKERMDLTLNPGESVTFKYRIAIITGKPDAEKLNTMYDSYTK
ncbi:MAG: hypothetical protein DWQ10_09630 [Calditrichaeota bacterium]|nr:MAG: hypothetical protein DWQ10_09630 [Calditrichota bacterium]